MPLAPYPVSFRFEMTNDDESLVFCVWCGGPNCSAYIFVYFCLPSATHKHINPTLNMTSSSSGSGSILKRSQGNAGTVELKNGNPLAQSHQLPWLYPFFHGARGPVVMFFETIYYTWCFLSYGFYHGKSPFFTTIWGKIMLLFFFPATKQSRI